MENNFFEIFLFGAKNVLNARIGTVYIILMPFITYGRVGSNADDHSGSKQTILKIHFGSMTIILALDFLD